MRRETGVADVAVALEMLLTDGTAAPPVAPGLRWAARLAAHPAAVLRRGAGLAAELGRIGLGTSALAPERGDPHYTDPAWTADPVLRRAVQAHLAASAAASGLLSDAELAPDDHERLTRAVGHVAAALAPSSTPLHPAVRRTAVDTGGRGPLRGLHRMVADLAGPPRVPTAAEPGALTPGTDVATTAGAVVLHTPVFELIRYLPRTLTVREVPVLLVPPLLNRYYLVDLEPGRSLVEHLVGSGQQVLTMSWRNPGPAHASWGLDTYCRAVLDAVDACERLTRSDRTVLMGVAGGGTLAAAVLAYLAAAGAQDRVAGLVLAGTVLDRAGAGADGAAVRRAVARSARDGYLDGRAVTGTWAWLAPRELVWDRVVHGWMRGEAPPPSALLSWNTDATRIPAALHRDLVEQARANGLAAPGGVTVLGAAVDLGKIDRDTYVVAGVADPRWTWSACYRTTGLLGGASRFVLAAGSHAGALATPPGEPGARWWAAGSTPADPRRWWADAGLERGSWWADLAGWLAARCGAEQDAPPELGGRGLHAVHPAPGTYVLAR